MARAKTYQVIKEYDSKTEYGLHVEPRFERMLSLFKKGEKFRPKDIIVSIPKSNETLGYDTITIGVKIGILKLVETDPTKYDDFCKSTTVQYFAEQLRGSKYKHKILASTNSTRQLYLYKLWRFNNWLIDKEFKFNQQIRINQNTLREQDVVLKLKGVEQLLELYQQLILKPSNTS